MPPCPHPARARRLWPRLAAALLLCAAHPSFAAELTSAELLEALQGAVAQEAASNAAAEASGRGTGGSSNFSSVFQGMRQVREALENGNDREVTQYLQSYVASNTRSAAVQKAVADLEARLRVERTAREAAVVAEADATMARAGEAAVKSKTARDMDPILANLSKLRERYNSYNGNMGEERQRLGQRVSTALQSLRTWQDYLVAVEGKRPGAARSADLPAREIGERLERIRREHPPEFAAGLESFQNPPRPDRGEGFPGLFPSQSGRPPATLTVPAVAPAPAAVASPSP